MKQKNPRSSEKKTAVATLVPVFLLRRMENEANGAKKDHVIAKVNEAKRTEHLQFQKSRERSKYTDLWYNNGFSDRNGGLWYLYAPLVLKGLRFVEFNVSTIFLQKIKDILKKLLSYILKRCAYIGVSNIYRIKLARWCLG